MDKAASHGPIPERLVIRASNGNVQRIVGIYRWKDPVADSTLQYGN